MVRRSVSTLDSLQTLVIHTFSTETHAYVLNFHGRVTQASVKNFQLVHAANGEILQLPHVLVYEYCCQNAPHIPSPPHAFSCACTSACLRECLDRGWVGAVKGYSQQYQTKFIVITMNTQSHTHCKVCINLQLGLGSTLITQSPDYLWTIELRLTLVVTSMMSSGL